MRRMLNVDLYQSLSHSTGLQVPRRVRAQGPTKAIFGQTRQQLGPIFHALARQKERQILEGHLLPDPCAYAVSTVGFELELIFALLDVTSIEPVELIPES